MCGLCDFCWTSLLFEQIFIVYRLYIAWAILLSMIKSCDLLRFMLEQEAIMLIGDVSKGQSFHPASPSWSFCAQHVGTIGQWVMWKPKTDRAKVKFDHPTQPEFVLLPKSPCLSWAVRPGKMRYIHKDWLGRSLDNLRLSSLNMWLAKVSFTALSTSFHAWLLSAWFQACETGGCFFLTYRFTYRCILIYNLNLRLCCCLSNHGMIFPKKCGVTWLFWSKYLFKSKNSNNNNNSHINIFTYLSIYII